MRSTVIILRMILNFALYLVLLSIVERAVAETTQDRERATWSVNEKTTDGSVESPALGEGCFSAARAGLTH